MLALFANTSFPAADQLLDTDIDSLRRCGFSATKIATIRGIAQATLSGVIPARAEALTMTDDALIDRLISPHGVGRWPGKILLIYTLERPNVLPAADFGIYEGYRRLKNLQKSPTANS